MLVRSSSGTSVQRLHSAGPRGKNRGDDFVVAIPSGALEAFKAAGIDNPKEIFLNKTVEVVGDVTLEGPGGMRPAIVVIDPKNIRIVE
jgi:hypothetical protein